jgi:SAM-dependent methyltransferase
VATTTAQPALNDRGAGEVIEGWEAAGEHLGRAYLRYSFTKGTEQEVAFLVDALGLEPGMQVLDVGCGPGRHAHALARRGIAAHGVDLSERFVALARDDAPAGATFEVADARASPSTGSSTPSSACARAGSAWCGRTTRRCWTASPGR